MFTRGKPGRGSLLFLDQHEPANAIRLAAEFLAIGSGLDTSQSLWYVTGLGSNIEFTCAAVVPALAH